MTQPDRVKRLVNVPGTFPSETVKPTAPWTLENASQTLELYVSWRVLHKP